MDRHTVPASVITPAAVAPAMTAVPIDRVPGAMVAVLLDRVPGVLIVDGALRGGVEVGGNEVLRKKV